MRADGNSESDRFKTGNHDVWLWLPTELFFFQETQLFDVRITLRGLNIQQPFCNFLKFRPKDGVLGLVPIHSTELTEFRDSSTAGVAETKSRLFGEKELRFSVVFACGTEAAFARGHLRSGPNGHCVRTSAYEAERTLLTGPTGHETVRNQRGVVLVVPGNAVARRLRVVAGRFRNAAPPTVVIVSSPVEESVVDSVDYTGRTDSAETVEIRSRVTGFLDEILFKDGTEVEKRPAAVSDRRSRVSGRSRRGQRGAGQGQGRAGANDGRLHAGRGAAEKRRPSRRAQFDQALAGKKLRRTRSVESGTAKVDRAELNVTFSKIAAPIAGKISRSRITVGNLVDANTTMLTTIVSVDPIVRLFRRRRADLADAHARADSRRQARREKEHGDPGLYGAHRREEVSAQRHDRLLGKSRESRDGDDPHAGRRSPIRSPNGASA